MEGNESEQIRLLHSRLDELRAVTYSMADRLGQSLQRMDANVAELSAAAQEFKSFKAAPHRQGIVQDVTESVGNLFSKHPRADEVAVLFGKKVSEELDSKLAKLAELDALQAWAGENDSRLTRLSDAVAEMKTNVAMTRQHVDGQLEAVSSKVGQELDSKLAKLAELEVELLRKEVENAESLASINNNLEKFDAAQNHEELLVNAVGNLSNEIRAMEKIMEERVMAKQTEELGSLRVNLLKIVENQNRLNEVLADSLTTLVDAAEYSKNTIAEVKMHVTELKSAMDLSTSEQMEKRIEEKIAKKLTGG